MRRLLRATRLLAQDRRLPKWLRRLGAFALLPIPGPVDEAVLLVLALILLAFHRPALREAWQRASID